MKKYSEYVRLSPNRGGEIVPKFIVLHHSAGSFAGSLDWISKSESRVSYHYLIRRSGALLVGKGLSQATYITSNPHGVTLWKKPDGRTISIPPDAWRNG